MTKYVIFSIIGGLLFAVLDGVINANPLAARLFEIYKPLARKSLNLIAGIVIDLVYGFVLAGVFWILYKSLPGDIGILKGISFGILVWFFRVVMSAASQWMMYTVPVKTTLYSVFSGLGEMLILGIFYGLTLKPGA